MTRDEWDALTPAAKCDLLEQRIAGDFFSESERDIVRDVVALARQNAHERDSAVERERLQRECVVCHADLEPDRVLVPHCNDCVVTDEHEWEWHDRLTQLKALGDADAPQSRADGPREPSTTPSSVEGPAGPRPLAFSEDGRCYVLAPGVPTPRRAVGQSVVSEARS